MKSTTIAIVATICALLTGAVFFAHIGTARAAADDCTLTSADFNQITQIQNSPTLTSAQEMAQELVLRKQLVTQTINCAQSDVQSVQSTLQNTVVSSDGESVQSALLGKLNDASNFYNLELQKLNGAGIAGTESVAKEVLAWRESSYEPLEGQVDNFILWSGNQTLFDTAQTRMDQTQREVSFLQDAAQDNDLQTAFDAAYASLQQAQSQNEAAKSALAQFLPPNQSLTLIKQSLDSLSDTYQDFFNLSTIIQTILPQQSQ